MLQEVYDWAGASEYFPPYFTLHRGGVIVYHEEIINQDQTLDVTERVSRQWNLPDVQDNISVLNLKQPSRYAWLSQYWMELTELPYPSLETEGQLVERIQIFLCEAVVQESLEKPWYLKKMEAGLSKINTSWKVSEVKKCYNLCTRQASRATNNCEEIAHCTIYFTKFRREIWWTSIVSLCLRYSLRFPRLRWIFVSENLHNNLPVVRDEQLLYHLV